MEDEGEGKSNEQQELGEGGVAGDKDENPLVSSLEHLFWQAKSDNLEKRLVLFITLNLYCDFIIFQHMHDQLSETQFRL